MRPHPATIILLALLFGAVGTLGFMAATRSDDGGGRARSDGPTAVAVQVAPVRRGIIRDVRTLSGTLEASRRFIVAAETAGQLRELNVGLSDPLARGQIIARVDDRGYVQAIDQARAELEVRKAERMRAQARLDEARAEHARETQLREDGVSSQSEFDASVASYEAAKAERAVAEARVAQANATIEIAEIRLDETRVRAEWAGEDDQAVVSERFQEPGNTLGVGEAIIAGVVLDPIRAIISVTERDYARLGVGQTVSLTADALPGRVFEGRVARISPVFRESSRQARIEIDADNPRGDLKPGMFVRVRIELEAREAHTIVPMQAVRTRDGHPVVFALTDSGDAVRELTVETGIADGDEIEIRSPHIVSPVVTLGQQLLDDGSPVRVANAEPAVPESPPGSGRAAP